jgi:hypothetical protein
MNGKLICTFALLAASALALAADHSLAGRWSVDFDVAGNARHSELTLAQTGDVLSGTMTTSGGDLAVVGRGAGGHATWSYDTFWQGQMLTLVFAGEFDATGKLVGTVDVRPLNVQGAFIATRAN